MHKKTFPQNDNNIIIFGTVISEPTKNILHKVNQNLNSIDIIVDEQDENKEFIINICNKYNGEIIKTLKHKNKKIPINNLLLKEPFTTIEFLVKQENGLKTRKYYYTKEKKQNIKGEFEIKNFNHGALIQFKETEFSGEEANINLILKDTILSYKCNRINQNILTTKFISYEKLINLKALEIIYKRNPEIKIINKINSSMFIPNEGLYISNNNITIDATNNFISDSTLIWISDSNINPPENSHLILGPYKINPITVPFNEKLEIKFNHKYEKGIGIYYYNSKKQKWIYMDTNYNNNIYSTLILSNEIFALIKETNPPKIENLIPDINATYEVEDIDKIGFNINDDLSGISNVDNISVEIDDIPLLFEYNTYRKNIFYDFEEWLTIGEHKLNIEIKDNVGNSTIIKGKFLIK